MTYINVLLGKKYFQTVNYTGSTAKLDDRVNVHNKLILIQGNWQKAQEDKSITCKNC